MKLLILPSWYPSEMDPNGVPFVRAQAQALVRGGHDVTVVFTQAYSLKTVAKQKRLMFGLREKVVEGVREVQSYFPKTHIKRIDQLTRLLMGKRRLKALVKKSGLPEMVHVHTYQAGPLALWFKRKYHLPLVVTEHYTGFARNMVKPWEMKMARELYGFSSMNLAVSGSFAALLKEKTSQPFSVLPNMVNTDLFTPSESCTASHTFLFVGSLHEKKNPRLLLEGFIRAYGKDDSLRLIFVGEGEMEGELKSLVEMTKWENAVSFRGFLKAPEIASLMKECCALVLPSRFETFGIVVIEAMSSGLPVIVTPSGGPEGFVKQDVTGLVIQPEVEEMEVALLKTTKKDWNREAIRQFVLDHFSETSVIKSLDEYYRKALEAPRLLQASRELNLSGGISKVACRLAQQMTARGIDVTTLTTEVGAELDDSSLGRTIMIPIPGWINFFPFYISKFLKTLFFTAKVDSIYRREGRDPGTITLSHRDSYGADIAIGHSCHKEAVSIKRREGNRFWFLNPVHPLYLTQEKKIFSKPWPHLAAISRSIADEYSRHYGIPGENIHIIPNGVETNVFTGEKSDEYRQEILEKLSLDKDSFLLLFVGNEFGRKGLDLIIKAIPLIESEREVHLIVLGGADKSAFEKTAHELKITDRVHFRGRTPETAPWFSAADLFILPANYEPFGLVGIEALASGTPVLAPRLGGFLDYLKDGENGYFIERDPRDIAEKVTFLIENPQILIKMGYNAHNNAQEYSWDRIGALYADLIKEVFQKKRS